MICIAKSVLKKYVLIIISLLFGILHAKTVSPEKISTLYKSLDPKSVSQNLAFYDLYPDSFEGKLALKEVSNLIGADEKDLLLNPFLAAADLNQIISLVNSPQQSLPKCIDIKTLDYIDKLGKSFFNRKLKGNKIWNEKEILDLPQSEIDLGRALLITEFNNSPQKKELVKYYEAILDLMTLQVKTRLTEKSSNEEKIRAINDFIFFENHFRFPPHTLFAKEIDTFTFLTSVIDKRRGVCLGVSILYFCIAQRLGLQLEGITPPGHIFLRFNNKDDHINIETTARGIDLPDELYLGIENIKLKNRNAKEIIGLALINQAAPTWKTGNFTVGVKLYEKAQHFLPNDPTLKELLACSYLAINKKKEGEQLLWELKNLTDPTSFSKNALVEDLLTEKTNIEAVRTLFLEVSEKRSSILEKNEKIKASLKRFPYFRDGIFQLAVGWLQLGREKEALELLKRYNNIDASSLVVNFYIAAISLERYDFTSAWRHLKICKNLVAAKGRLPKALLELEERLKEFEAEPLH